jgi:hypothetical protein
MLGPVTIRNPVNDGGEKLEISLAFSTMYCTWKDSLITIGRWGITVLKLTWATPVKKTGHVKMEKKIYLYDFIQIKIKRKTKQKD